MCKGRILIVDDIEIVLTALQRVFEDAGYYVRTALNGKEAVETVKRESFDIVYTDMIMPGMNGVEVCKEIKSISPDTEVILFSGTAHGVAKYQIEFIASGGREELLRKPLSKNEMLGVTEKILQELKGKS
ncbi:MAG: response regulator [bacterium]